MGPLLARLGGRSYPCLAIILILDLALQALVARKGPTQLQAAPY